MGHQRCGGLLPLGRVDRRLPWRRRQTLHLRHARHGDGTEIAGAVANDALARLEGELARHVAARCVMRLGAKS